MERTKDAPKDKLYRSLIRQVRRLCLPKTTKALLEGFVFYHVYADAIFPGQKSLAQKLKVSRRTVIRMLNQLEKDGFIARTQKKSRLRTRIYLVHIGSLSLSFRAPSPILSTLEDEPSSPSLVSPEMSHKRKEDYIKPLGDQEKTRSGGLQEEKAFKTPSQVVSFQLSEEDKRVAQEMVSIMAQETQGAIKPDPRYRCTSRKLVWHIKHRCGGVMPSWRAFCQRIASSDYLMGRTSGFIPPLLWLIKDETVQKLRSGNFHRYAPSAFSEDSSPESFLLTPKPVTESQNPWDNSWTREQLEQRLRQQVEREQDAYEHKILQAITQDQEQELRKAFEAELQDEETSLALNFREKGWDCPLVRMGYMFWKKKKLCQGFDFESQLRERIQASQTFYETQILEKAS